MQRLTDLNFGALKAIIASLLALMVLMVFGNVVLRYGFNSGITVSEELARWSFVWLVLLGAIGALREHQHLGMDFIAEMERFRAATRSVVDKHSAAADPVTVKELFDSIAKARGK